LIVFSVKNATFENKISLKSKPNAILTMRSLYLLAFMPFLLGSCIFGGIPGGNYPSTGDYGGRRTEKGTTIDRIELTEQYTILYMTHTNINRPYRTRDGRVFDGSEVIGVRRNARLFALGGSRSFNLVRAEGIPYDPQRRTIRPGDRVSFVLYFDRLDRGIEEFDLFECNDSDQFTCWNFYGVRVRNPALVPIPKQQPKQEPLPPVNVPVPPKAETPKPAPQPETPKQIEVLINGVVTDAKTKKPVSATIDFVYSLNKKLVDSVQSFSQTGLYRIKLLAGHVYQLSASAKGYLVATDVIDLTKVADGQVVKKDIALTPLVVGDKITLSNIYFEMSKSDLLEASFAELDKLVTLMQDNPNMTIRLEGHTDIIGDKEANLQLSKDRVWNVRKYLVKKNIDQVRIEAVGYGDTRPIVTKGTDEDRKINRRVEFVILKM
jgi:OmpA-OmpF porin, OOP family